MDDFEDFGDFQSTDTAEVKETPEEEVERDTFDDIIEENIKRRERILANKYNCLPLPFERFRKLYPGFEQGKYILLTANQKIGKSKLADYLFVYGPLFTMMEHPELKIKVLYFSLEMSVKEKKNEFLCHLLYRLGHKRISTRLFRNTDKLADLELYDLVNTPEYRKYRKAYENIVEFNDTSKKPTRIFMECKDYALAHGHMNYIPGKVIDKVTDELVDGMITDPANPYTPDDEDEYRIVIIDNAANLLPEDGAPTRRDSIDRLSKYAIELRNKFKFIIVLIQHQAQAQEGIENIKLDRMHPTTDGLGDCKTTSRDANCVIGLYSPHKFKKKVYEGYDTDRLGNYCRFLEILEDRDYGANGNACPLFFDGAVCEFKELPLPTNLRTLESYYRYAESLNPTNEEEELSLSNPN